MQEMKMGRCKVSILMGVYNCEMTLKAAVESIQRQTYGDWELIICDDGSSDGTYDVAEHLSKKDLRITVFRNEINKGLNITLNRCFAASKGDYIARMDGDDECLPDRFQKQIDFLESHPEYGFVSTPMILFDERGEWGRTLPIEIPTAEQVVTEVPFAHAPVMFRRECLERVHGYTEDRRMLRVEDINLWIKLYTAGYRGYNLQEPLYRMRNDKNAFHRRKYRYRINSTYVRLRGCRELHLGFRAYLKAFKPMIAGIVPTGIRQYIRVRQNNL